MHQHQRQCQESKKSYKLMLGFELMASAVKKLKSARNYGILAKALPQLRNAISFCGVQVARNKSKSHWR